MTTVQYIPPQGNFFNKSQRVGTQEEVVLKWGKNHERYGKEIVTHSLCAAIFCFTTRQRKGLIQSARTVPYYWNTSWLWSSTKRWTIVQFLFSHWYSPWRNGVLSEYRSCIRQPSVYSNWSLTKPRAHPHAAQQQQQQVIAGNGLKTVRHCSEFVWKINCGEVCPSLKHGCLC